MRAGVRGAAALAIAAAVACSVPATALSPQSAGDACGSAGSWLLPPAASFPARTPGWLAAGPMAVRPGSVWFNESRYHRHRTTERIVTLSSSDGHLHASRGLTNQYFAGFGDASAWYSEPSTGNWTELDPSTGDVAATFAPGQLVAKQDSYEGLWGSSVAAGSHAAWLAGVTHRGIAVSEVNLDTRAVDWTTLLPGAAHLPAGTGAGIGIAASEGSGPTQTHVLVALPTSLNHSVGLWSLDGTGALLARTSYAVPPGLIDAVVAVNAHSAYVVQYRNGYGTTTLTRYDATNLASTTTRRFFFPFTTVVTDTAVSVVTETGAGCGQLELDRLDPVGLTDVTSPVSIGTTVIGASDTALWTLDGNDRRAPFYGPRRLTEHRL